MRAARMTRSSHANLVRKYDGGGHRHSLGGLTKQLAVYSRKDKDVPRRSPVRRSPRDVLRLTFKPARQTPGRPREKIHRIFCRKHIPAHCSLSNFLGLTFQNTTFIRTTISATTTIETQKPTFKPRYSAVPKSFIQIFIQFIIHTSIRADRRNGAHKLFSDWSQEPYTAGCKGSGRRSSLPAALRIQASGQIR